VPERSLLLHPNASYRRLLARPQAGTNRSEHTVPRGHALRRDPCGSIVHRSRIEPCSGSGGAAVRRGTRLRIRGRRL
jgi:hypothetical protein